MLHRYFSLVIIVICIQLHIYFYFLYHLLCNSEDYYYQSLDFSLVPISSIVISIRIPLNNRRQIYGWIYRKPHEYKYIRPTHI